MPDPYISGWLYVPHQHVTDLDGLKKQLQVVPRPFGEQKRDPIPMHDDSVPRYIGVPPDFGFTYLSDKFEIEDRTSLGHKVEYPKRPDPYHPLAADGQAEFMEDVRFEMEQNHAVLGVADTGTGKTVVALDTAAHFGTTLVVVVHLERLKQQWIEAAKEHLGLTDDDIGVVQGKKCVFKGKKVVIAMAKSLAQREYDPELYDYFGMAVWDEVHRMGAPLCRKTLGQFSAAYKLGLTATVERADRCERVYLLYFGGASVIARMKPVHADLHFIRYRTHRAVWGEDHGTRVKCLSRDPQRNRMLAFYIKKMYDAGHHVLAIGDSIHHIEEMMLEMENRGIPANHLGQYTGEYTDDNGKRQKTENEYFDWCKRVPRIIFATYGTMKEGIDIPRLNGGIELTPRSDLIQVIGRVRRKFAGKTNSVWYSPVDLAFGSFIGYFKKRRKEAEGDGNITIHIHGK